MALRGDLPQARFVEDSAAALRARRRQLRGHLEEETASLGGGLEYYDFIVYGIFAKDIAAAFFPAM